ncbi:hypothetical protein C7R16_13330 [Staphylococcus aureus]|nr:hypothetical protein RK94_002115 [Staphylococcus aureus]PZG77512.1 hypothetical protein C7R16_13330 [Staphylococcus aureus]RYL35883.1 hypothetical protein EVD29_10815 [Staphylococcus aureus]HEK6015606.1 hypothetical protein [Staphylococcus aureus]
MSGVINYQFRLNGVLIFKIEFLIYYYVWYTNQCSMLYKVILAVVDCSLQHRGFGMSASISCKLAELQHSGIGFPISTDIANWGNGPQTQKLVESQLTITCKLAGPQHSGIGFPISTDDASWRGHNIVELDSQFLQTLQVGEATNSETGGKSA